jgi:hypothetical protein
MLCRGLLGRSSEASPTTFLVMAIGPFCWCGASLQPAKPNPATRHWLPTPECSVSIAEGISDLLRPEAFNHPAQALRLIETHISWVILAGDYAYKLRKAVNFGFLDFSTPEQRRADCEAEVRLNRRLCGTLAGAHGRVCRAHRHTRRTQCRHDQTTRNYPRTGHVRASLVHTAERIRSCVNLRVQPRLPGRNYIEGA